MILPVSKGSRFSRKQSAQPLFTVFYNILLMSSSTSSSPSCNRWPGRPHNCSLSLAVGGSMQSQMEAKLASMNLRFTRTPSPTCLVPPLPALQHQCHSPPVARIRRELFFLISRFYQIRREPKRPRDNLAHTKINAASKTTHRISAPALASSAPERGTWAGVSSLGQVTERDTPPRKIFPSTLGLPAHRHRLFTGNPAIHSPCFDGGHSLDELSPTMGDG